MIPVVVLGGSGYVAGELLRLLAGHPHLRPSAILSESQAGEAVESAFPHLAGCFPGLKFSGREGLFEGLEGQVAVFCAAPHGAAAALLDEVLAEAEAKGLEAHAVDLSADFRFADAAEYERVYGHAHGAPGRLASFSCAVPEHANGTVGHKAHPGCFTTATLLATVPLLKLGLVEPRVSVVAVTGSTGAGKTPTATTHHPARRSNLYAYNPLSHRHEPEMEALAKAASGVEAEIHFIPQAGPFARGIYATVQGRLLKPGPGEAAVRAALASFYDGSPFVDVLAAPPRLQDVVGTNRCRMGVAVDGDHVAVFSAIDNLVKGAAGGGIQWMNRLLGLPETAGLNQPGPGWL